MPVWFSPASSASVWPEQGGEERSNGVWPGEKVGGEGVCNHRGGGLGSQGRGGQRSRPRPGFSLNLQQLSESWLALYLVAVAGWRPVGPGSRQVSVLKQLLVWTLENQCLGLGSCPIYR